ncbi:MAG TPA: DnaA/Hda family protein [Candidatus Binatia bacterium]|nr:DnaA/Hda family protein [Candidatus Binatia bacterium]
MAIGRATSMLHTCGPAVSLPAVAFAAGGPPAGLPVRALPPPPEHSFASFVVGESNAPAHRAATLLARGGDRVPLVLHGPSGVGKTHLLHATHAALAERGRAVACLPAAELTQALLAAYRANRHRELWRDLGVLDAILLDDVHSLAGHEQVQGHLAEGLIAWVEGGRALALTADRAPEDVPELAGRWRQRFGEATVVHLPAPEPALRTAILHHKARRLGLDLDDDLASVIAQRLAGSVRRLEGALTRLLAHVRLSGRPIDRALVEEVLPAPVLLARGGPSLGRIVGETAVAFGLPARLLRGRRRRSELVVPRRVAMFLSHRLLRRPLAEIARAFHRDRTTVHHACAAVAAQLDSDPQLAGTIRRIEERLITSA